MPSIINAITTGVGGVITRADASGVLQLQSNGTTTVTIDTSANLQFNSGYGSVATAYGCRAWVNWQGTGTVTIRGSGNVSSITDGGVGVYTVNFTNAMPDTNFACLSACGSVSGANGGTLQTTQIGATVVAPTTTSQWVAAATDQGNLYDTQFATVAIFR